MTVKFDEYSRKIVKFLQYHPTFRTLDELGDEVGLKETGSVACRLNRLEKYGMIAKLGRNYYDVLQPDLKMPDGGFIKVGAQAYYDLVRNYKLLLIKYEDLEKKLKKIKDI